MKSSAEFGFLEMSLVVVTLGLLALIAIPQSIDFRSEARDSSTKQALKILRQGLLVQKANMFKKCGDPTHVVEATQWPEFQALASNNINLSSACAASSKIGISESSFVPLMLPVNPWGGSSVIYNCTAPKGCNRVTACDGTTPWAKSASDGWCYSPTNGKIWPNSANSTGQEPEYTF